MSVEQNTDFRVKNGFEFLLVGQQQEKTVKGQSKKRFIKNMNTNTFVDFTQGHKYPFNQIQMNLQYQTKNGNVKVIDIFYTEFPELSDLVDAQKSESKEYFYIKEKRLSKANFTLFLTAKTKAHTT